MNRGDCAEQDAVGLAQLIAKRQISRFEVLDAAIEVCERHNTSLNAVCYEGFDDSRE